MSLFPNIFIRSNFKTQTENLDLFQDHERNGKNSI